MANHREIRAEQFEHDIIHRAISDSAFRAELVANPNAVLRRELAKVRGNIGPHVNVHVIEENASNIYIVLPPRGFVPKGYDPYKIGRS